MKRILLHAAIAAIGLALGSAALAQGRHDDKPHGVPGKPAAAPDSSVTDRTPGRHDERPHGKAKKKSDKSASAKKAAPKKSDDAK